VQRTSSPTPARALSRGFAGRAVTAQIRQRIFTRPSVAVHDSCRRTFTPRAHSAASKSNRVSVISAKSLATRNRPIPPGAAVAVSPRAPRRRCSRRSAGTRPSLQGVFHQAEREERPTKQSVQSLRAHTQHILRRDVTAVGFCQRAGRYVRPTVWSIWRWTETGGQGGRAAARADRRDCAPTATVPSRRRREGGRRPPGTLCKWSGGSPQGSNRQIQERQASSPVSLFPPSGCG